MKREDLPLCPPAEVTDAPIKRETPHAPAPAAPARATQLVVTPHPLTPRGQQVLDAQAAALVPGETLAVFLQRHGVRPGQQWVVAIGGAQVPEALWHRVRPKHGHLIEARRVPEKSVLRLVALAALAYFTFGAGVGAAGFLGLGTGFAGNLAATIVYAAGSAIINKLLGPKQQAQASTNVALTYSLQGGRNQARPFQPLGLVLGEPYVVPDLAALPYTFFANGEAYLWQLFHCGINCADFNTLRIGQTPIDSYIGVSIQRDGFSLGNTGLPTLGLNVDTVPGGLLTSDGVTFNYVERTSPTNTIVLAIDIEAQLYNVFNNGQYALWIVGVDAEYRAVGSGTWLPFQGTDPAIVLQNASSKPLRVTYQLAVAAGQYGVRLRKRDADISATNRSNTVTWLSMKSFQLDTGDYTGQSRLGVQIQASGQLNGSLDELNGRAVAKSMPYWNGSAWTTATVRANGLCNPGAIFLLLARGIYAGGRLVAGLGLADAQIDIEGLKLFMVRCAALDVHFDLFVQDATTIGDLLDTVAAAGMGAVAWPDGKLGVTWFAENQPVEGVLNMATQSPKTFSVEYDTQATADELEIQYFDRDRGYAWQTIRVRAPGVVTPQNTARQQLVGVGTERHAALLGRFYMAQNVYQRKTVGLEVDLEHMTFRRGTVLALSHDLTQWGYGGRLKAAVNNAGTVTLTLDDVVPAVSPVNGATSRYIGLRLAGEQQYRVFPVASFAGSSLSVTLATAWPGGVPVPGDSADNPAHDAVWIYDFKATPGQKLRVAACSPKQNLQGARVALVPESDEFWTYTLTGQYDPPPNNSLLTRAAPMVTRAVVTEELQRQGSAFATELTVTFDVTGNYDRAELWGAIDGGAPRRLASTLAQSLSWPSGLDDVWALEVRVFSAIRVGTPYQLSYTVLGLRIKPGTPQGVAVTQEKIFAQPITDPDLAGYRVRSVPGVVVATASDWARGTDAHKGVITELPWPFINRLYGVQTVMMVAEDTSGNISETPGYASLDFGQPDTNNVAQSRDFKADLWPIVTDIAPIVLPVFARVQNLVVQSEALDDTINWTRTALTGITANSANGPAGTAVLDKVIANATVTSHHVDEPMNGLADNEIFSGAIHARRGDYARVGFQLLCKNASGPQLVFDFDTKVITATSLGTGQVGVVFSVEEIGAGSGLWLLMIENVSAMTGGTVPKIRAQLRDDAGVGGFAGDGAKGTHYGAAQWNRGATLMPYTATGASAVDLTLYSPVQYDYDVSNVTAFAQPGTTTFIDANGVLQYAPPNTLRIQDAQLLVEGDATNLYTSPESQTAGTGTTVNVNAGTAPDGSATADDVIETVATSEHYSTDRSIAVERGQTYTFSTHVEALGVGALRKLYLRTALAHTAVLVFNPVTGLIEGATGVVASKVSDLAGGRWRVSMTIVAESSGNLVARHQLYNNATIYAGDGVSGLRIWGANFVLGDLSSYINSAGTRVADVVNVSTEQSGWQRATDLVAQADPAGDVDVLGDIDIEPDLDATLWQAITYVSDVFVPQYAGGTLVLDLATVGAAVTVEYRIDGGNTVDLDLAADMDVLADLDSAVGQWAQWPGQLSVQAWQGVQWRVTITGGSLQPAITSMVGRLTLRRDQQTFAPMVISSAGTRLAPAAGLPPHTWFSVQTVVLTPVVDGSTATSSRVIDFSSELGPLVQLVDATGAAVTGTASGIVGGLLNEAF